MLRQHVRWIERGRPAVLALGGGAFVSPANRELVTTTASRVWLDCPFETVAAARGAGPRTGRWRAIPSNFAALYQARREIYRLADVHIPIESDDPEHAVAAILAHPLMQ